MNKSSFFAEMRSRSLGLAFVGLSTCALITGCGTSDDNTSTASTDQTPVTGTMTTPPAEGCRTTALNASVAATSQSGDSHTITFALTNKSQAACPVSGFPDVELFNKDTLVASKLTQNVGSTNLAPVTLSPQESAYFDVTYSAKPQPANEACVAITRVTITPANEVDQLLLPLVNNDIPVLCNSTQPSTSVIRGTKAP